MEELARADARNRAQTGQKADAKPETAEDIVERIFGADAQNDPKVQQAAEAAKAAATGVKGDAPGAGETTQTSASETAAASLAANLFSALVRRFRPRRHRRKRHLTSRRKPPLRSPNFWSANGSPYPLPTNARFASSLNPA